MNKHLSKILNDNLSEVLVDLKAYLDSVSKVSFDQDAIQEG